MCRSEMHASLPESRGDRILRLIKRSLISRPHAQPSRGALRSTRDVVAEPKAWNHSMLAARIAPLPLLVALGIGCGHAAHGPAAASDRKAESALLYDSGCPFPSPYFVRSSASWVPSPCDDGCFGAAYLAGGVPELTGSEEACVESGTEAYCGTLSVASLCRICSSAQVDGADACASLTRWQVDSLCFLESANACADLLSRPQIVVPPELETYAIAAESIDSGRPGHPEEGVRGRWVTDDYAVAYPPMVLTTADLMDHQSVLRALRAGISTVRANCQDGPESCATLLSRLESAAASATLP